MGAQVGVLLDRGVQAFEIAVAEPLGDLPHLPLDPRHLLKADLVDLLRGQVGRRRRLDPEGVARLAVGERPEADLAPPLGHVLLLDRKSTRLNSSHVKISYAVFCLKKKKKTI